LIRYLSLQIIFTPATKLSKLRHAGHDNGVELRPIAGSYVLALDHRRIIIPVDFSFFLVFFLWMFSLAPMRNEKSI
jgi:hypothetical protein